MDFPSTPSDVPTIHFKTDRHSRVLTHLYQSLHIVENLLAASYPKTLGLTEMMWPLRPWAASAHSITALSCGYPTPVFFRVVHTEPRKNMPRVRVKYSVNATEGVASGLNEPAYLAQFPLWWCQPQRGSTLPPSLLLPHSLPETEQAK